MPYALDLAMAASDGSDTDRTMVEVARLMVRFYNTVSSQSQFLTSVAKEELPAIGQDLADYYSKLASEAFEAGKNFGRSLPNCICGSTSLNSSVLISETPVITGPTPTKTSSGR